MRALCRTSRIVSRFSFLSRLQRRYNTQQLDHSFECVGMFQISCTTTIMDHPNYNFVFPASLLTPMTLAQQMYIWTPQDSLYCEPRSSTDVVTFAREMNLKSSDNQQC
jgi:hypothetical protein